MIYLSFDIEEFDVPLESGIDIDFSEQMRISIDGTLSILDILNNNGVKATFFCTANFAINAPEIITKIASQGHEIASHGFYHSDFKLEHLISSKLMLEKIADTDISGFRMARMMPVDEKEVYNAGYSYNSSINPTFIPGRYNNLNISRVPFMKDGVLQIPTAVTKMFRLPLFWLSVHNFPFWFYKILLKKTIKNTQEVAIYFHPWEFYELNEVKNRYKLPFVMVNNSGIKLKKRLDRIIKLAKSNNIEFGLMRDIKL